MRSNTRCIYLSLRKNLLGDEGAIELAKVIRASYSLVHIDLASTGLRMKGGFAIFRALQKNESVISLDLSSCLGLIHNRIGQFSTEALIPVLSKKILTILNLSGNAIKLHGLQNIAKGIIGNNTLLSLKIANNELEGGTKCLGCLKKILLESNLKEFDISDNPLGNRCFEAFINILAASSVTKIYCCSVNMDCITFT